MKRWLTSVLCTCALLGICLNALGAWRQASVRIQSVTSSFENDIMVVDAYAEISLGEKVQDALANGLPLSYEFTVEVRKARPFWWDETQASATRHLRIEYHELSRQYMVEDLDSNSRRVISDLKAALRELGTVHKMAVINRSALDKNSGYRARARAELSVEEIPLPLRASSYLSADWHQESGWYAWPLR